MSSAEGDLSVSQSGLSEHMVAELDRLTRELKVEDWGQ